MPTKCMKEGRHISYEQLLEGEEQPEIEYERI